MIKIEELTNPQSCMSRARDGEMTFVLLARDIAAPNTIRNWVKTRLSSGKNVITDPQIKEALACADAMEAQRVAEFPSVHPDTERLDWLIETLQKTGSNGLAKRVWDRYFRWDRSSLDLARSVPEPTPADPHQLRMTRFEGESTDYTFGLVMPDSARITHKSAPETIVDPHTKPKNWSVRWRDSGGITLRETFHNLEESARFSNGEQVGDIGLPLAHCRNSCIQYRTGITEPWKDFPKRLADIPS